LKKDRYDIMYLKVLFKGFNFSQDGPGNRLVYHLQGCNMRCPWCSTPESFPLNGSLMLKGFAKSDLCPFDNIKNGKPDFYECDLCENKPCLDVPGSPLKLSCKDVSVDDLVLEAERSRAMFFSGGGVTFTGGEPTLQFEPLKEALSRLRSLGIHTAIETNASVSKLPELFEHIDWLIMDLKHYDSGKLKETVGIGGETVFKNFEKAAKMRKQMLVHIPLINGFNAEAEDAEKFAEFLTALDCPFLQVELLRYHEFGKDKWAQCGLEYKMKNAFVSDEQYQAFLDVFKSHHLNIVKT